MRLLVRIFFPFFLQMMRTAGYPSAWHFRWKRCRYGTVRVLGGWTVKWGRPAGRTVKDKKVIRQKDKGNGYTDVIILAVAEEEVVLRSGEDN